MTKGNIVRTGTHIQNHILLNTSDISFFQQRMHSTSITGTPYIALTLREISEEAWLLGMAGAKALEESRASI